MGELNGLEMDGLLVKYPKIHTLGSPETQGILDEIIVCESKVDGANFRARYIPEEERFIFGSRNNLLGDDTSPITWKAIGLFRKALTGYKDKIIPQVIYFAESMQKHTIKYEGIPDAIGYDVFDLERGEFYNWKGAKQAFEQIGIPFINVHFEKFGKDIKIEELKELIKKSPYREEGDEGIVLKCYKKKNIFGRTLFAKIVDDLFKEANKKEFGDTLRTVVTDELEVAETYMTEARMLKALNSYIDAGETISMSLMPKLYKYVMYDILNENISDIAEMGRTINFKLFRNIIANKTAKMLKAYLLNKATVKEEHGLEGLKSEAELQKQHEEKKNDSEGSM